MKLAELLAGMSGTKRDELARHIGWDGNRDDLAKRLGTIEQARALYDSLFDLERRVFAQIVKRFGCEPFGWSKLEKAGQKTMSGAAIKVGLIRLMRKGIVFGLKRNWGDTDYMLPEDVFPLWSGLVLPQDRENIVYNGDDIAADSPFRPGIAACMLFVLSYVAREEVTVTQKGGMHKRHAGRLAALVPIRDDELAQPAAAPGGKAAFGSLATEFLCSAALELGLLVKGEERLTVRPERLAEWFRMSEPAMNAVLYAYWRQANRVSEPWLQHAAAVLERMPEESWISLDRVVRQLAEAGIGAPETSPGESPGGQGGGLLESHIAAMSAWGWAETGSSANGERLFRWIRKPSPAEVEPQQNRPATTAAGESRPLFVQPDFELIVAPDCPYSVRWELEMIAERVRCEHVAVYRLTRETAVRGIEHGRTADRIATFLESLAKYGLPANVRATIALWGEQQSQLKLISVTVLKLRDEATARTIGGDERLAPFLEEALGPTAWVVRADKIGELRALLVQSGYSPGDRKQGEADLSAHPLPEPEHKPQPAPASALPAEKEVPSKGLIYSKTAVQYYDSEHKFPLIEDVYPGLQDIPPMWLKDCRSYHVSTRKQMIQKALEWKACLRLRIAGADTDFVPLRLDGIRDEWAVTGFGQHKEVRLLPDQWEEMQLILPGIND